MELNNTPMPNKSFISSYRHDNITPSAAPGVRSEAFDQRPTEKLSLGELKEGQIVRGEVVDLRYQEVKVRLEPSQHIIRARIANDTPLTIGQEAQFEVIEVNENQLVLKFSSQESTVYDNTIQKALQASSLPMTARNQSIVAELLKHQLPIDKQTIQTLIRTSMMNKDIAIETIITAFQHKVPLTKENLARFHSILQGNTSFHPDSKELSTELIRTMKHIFSSNDNNGLMIHSNELTNNVTNGGNHNLMITSSHNTRNDTPANLIDLLLSYTLTRARQEDTLRSIFHGESLDLLLKHLQLHIKSESMGPSEQAIYSQIKDGSADIVDTMNFIQSTLADENSLDNTINQGIGNPISVNDKSILGPLLDLLYERSTQLNQTRESLQGTLSHVLQSPVSKATLSQVLGERGDDLHPILEQLFNQRFIIDSDELKKQGAIPAHYQRIRDDLDSIISLVRSSHGLTDSDPLPALVKETSDDLQLMKTMNDFFQFLTIPLQLHNTEGKGELYVYRKKAALAKRQDSLNVFMHLDMVHLGPLDIQLLLHTEPKFSLNASFYTENDSIKHLLQSNLHHLSDQLQKIGYHFQGHVQSDKPLSQPLTDLLDNPSFDMSHGRYTFDIRA